MRILKHIGQLLWSGLKAGILGALACGVVGVLSFGLVIIALFAFLDAVTRPNGGLLNAYNIRLNMTAGLGLGAFFGALAWLPVGLLRAVYRRELPVKRMTGGALVGSFVGASVVALDVLAYLYYLAITLKPTSIQLSGFLGTGGVPSHIGGLLTTDFIPFATFGGFVLGLIVGSWWGAYTPRLPADKIQTANSPVPETPTPHGQRTTLSMARS